MIDNVANEVPESTTRDENSTVCGKKNSHECPQIMQVSDGSNVKSAQEAQLSPRDHAMRYVSRNLANCHTTVQKLLVRQVLNKSKL